MSANKITMIPIASHGSRNPKKAGAHNAFAANCQPHNRNGRDAPSRFQTNQPAVPIMTYSTVQTGAKTQFGGVPGGAFRVRNQVWTARAVIDPPTAPSSRHSPINPTSAKAGEMGTDEPGNDPPSLGPDCWKTPLLSESVTNEPRSSHNGDCRESRKFTSR